MIKVLYLDPNTNEYRLTQDEFQEVSIKKNAINPQSVSTRFGSISIYPHYELTAKKDFSDDRTFFIFVSAIPVAKNVVVECMFRYKTDVYVSHKDYLSIFKKYEEFVEEMKNKINYKTIIKNIYK